MKDPAYCGKCLFYRLRGDDTGTCDITDNIVEPFQDACSDYQPITPKEDGKD